MVTVIVLLIALVVISTKPKYIQQAFDKQFLDFFEAGEYDLSGSMVPTEKFPDGFSYRASVVLTKKPNSVVKECRITGYNTKNNKNCMRVQW